MKILYDYRIFLLQKFGGISRYFINLNKKFDNSKIYSPININYYLKQEKEKKITHVNFKSIPKFCRKLFFFYNNICTNFYINKYRPDIIHLTYFDKRLNFKKKNPLVITVYDLIHEIFHKDYGKNENYRPKKKYIEIADHIICISYKTKKDLIMYYEIDPKKISVVHLGVNKPNPKIQNNNNINIDKSFILFVGDRKNYKNFSLLLRAFADSYDLKKNFNIFCAGGGEFLNSELELIKKLEIDQSSVLQKDITDDELSFLYSKASVFVFPSKYEGFGLPALEAMSHGCQVLASDIEIFREILSDFAIYFDPNSAQDLKKKLEKQLFENTSDKVTLSIKLKKYSENFTWEKCVKKTEEVYKKLI